VGYELSIQCRLALWLRIRTRRAISGLMHGSKEVLFNNFVGGDEQRLRDAKTQRVSGSLIDDKSKAGPLLKRQIAGFGALQDASDQAADARCRFLAIRAV
jgi:hypothetical protein